LNIDRDAAMLGSEGIAGREAIHVTTISVVSNTIAGQPWLVASVRQGRARRNTVSTS
jgi:hypothetical protein